MVPVSGPLWESPCYRGEKLFFLIKVFSLLCPWALKALGMMFGLPTEVLWELASGQDI